MELVNGVLHLAVADLWWLVVVGQDDEEGRSQ
jgi:hypothetical protein